MAAAAKKATISPADAAVVLGCYESDVASVDEAEEGTVATTTDGQRYVLNGTAREEFTWLKAGPTVPQILAKP